MDHDKQSRLGEDDEGRFRRDLDGRYDAMTPDMTKTLKIVVIGKVSTGKSSLINALLRRTRSNGVMKVGARSGVTKSEQAVQLDENTRIIDSPGLDDILKEHNERARDALFSTDVGVLVVTGSADASQRRHFEELSRVCKKVFVVLNKVDEWDRLSPPALSEVIEQWKEALGVDTIYPTCTFGYDPETRADTDLDLRGVDELRAALETFLDHEGKALLLARHMGEKRTYAQKIILSAVVTTGAEAFIPGSAAFIAATQAAAITALYYLYTGRVLSKSSALGLLPVFAAEAVGVNLFLVIKSLLPPTGIVDMAAAGVAASVTAAMLLAVNALLASGHELHESDRLRAQFRALQSSISATVSGASKADLVSQDFWRRALRDLMYA